jgi:GDP-6-deoxy-D-talose 4-dehydrogenase
MKVLIFGGNSFTASHFGWKNELDTLLVTRSHFTYQLSQNGAEKSINKLIQEFNPDVVINLISVAATALDDCKNYLSTNFLISKNILDGCAMGPIKPKKFIQVSSAHVYGPIESSSICEKTSLNPKSPYAKTKTMADMLASLYENYFKVIITRPFNYSGAGQNVENFFLPKLINAAHNRESKITLGNINLVRDFSDVRDISSYYRALVMNHEANGIINLCSGKGYLLGEIVEEVQRLSGHYFDIEKDDSLGGGLQSKTQIGSNDKLIQVTGLHPQYSITDTIRWMLESMSSKKRKEI